MFSSGTTCFIHTAFSTSTPTYDQLFAGIVWDDELSHHSEQWWSLLHSMPLLPKNGIDSTLFPPLADLAVVTDKWLMDVTVWFLGTWQSPVYAVGDRSWSVVLCFTSGRRWEENKENGTENAPEVTTNDPIGHWPQLSTFAINIMWLLIT